MSGPARILVFLALLLPAACASGDGQEGWRIEGTLLDAETGKPVSRETVYCHFFHDETDLQKSLDPTDDEEFEVMIPEPVVRVRIADTSGGYHLYERTITLTEPTTRIEVRLRPTHYVRLSGKVIDARTKQVILPGSDGGHGPLLYVTGPDGFGIGPEWLEEDGSFSVLVPRGPIEFQAVDTAKRIRNPKLDLTGHEGDERTYDLLLE